LFAEREKRIKPGRDEKILTAWNGLMLRSFAEAANALDREDYRQVAIRNAEFVFSHLQRNGRLLRSYKDGVARLNAYLEDYAFFMDGLLSLYETTFDPRWIREAVSFAEILTTRFLDSEGAGFYLTADDHEALITRPKDFYDNATPSGNSVAAYALLRLAKLTGNERWTEYARAVLKSLAVSMARYPSAFGNLLCALDLYAGRTREIAVVGDPQSTQTRALLRAVFGRYLPNKVVACGLNGDVYLLEGRTQVGGAPAVYVCENYVCQSPVRTSEELAALLGGHPSKPPAAKAQEE
jgi:hypothetical protein